MKFGKAKIIKIRKCLCSIVPQVDILMSDRMFIDIKAYFVEIETLTLIKMLSLQNSILAIESDK
jgi:hypothetical protein